MTECQQLLADYAATGSEPAFRELVARYVNLVHSAAFRLVNGDAHLAEDVTQTVFADLARMARKLSRDTLPGGWLHRHTCFVASNLMRGERRRQFRERQAAEMNSIEDHSGENLALIAPVLDDAINELGPEDRAAILLRFFEQKDFQSVGQTLGGSEDAARKRVHRALEKLHALLTRRGVVLSASALAGTLGAQAVSAAPAGLALTVSTAALATAAAGGGATLTLIEIMSMTKLKVGVATVVVAALAIPLAMEHRENKQLREEIGSLRGQQEQINGLSAENERLSDLLAQVQARSAPATAATNEEFREVLKLRGEVGRLRTAVSAPKPSPISGVIADPEMRKMIRDQQKVGMTMIYRGLTNRIDLPPELREEFVDLLADDIMESVDQVGLSLRDGKSREEVDQLFTEQEAALRQKISDLLGPDGYSEFQDYTQNLAGHLTTEQFKGELTGDSATKEDKAAQLYELIREETFAALGDAGLPSDYQVVPILNFRNIASEEAGEESLKLMESVYDRVIARAPAFLSPEEVEKFNAFRTVAIQNNRTMLVINRKMMAPPR